MANLINGGWGTPNQFANELSELQRYGQYTVQYSIHWDRFWEKIESNRVHIAVLVRS